LAKRQHVDEDKKQNKQVFVFHRLKTTDPQPLVPKFKPNKTNFPSYCLII
jgi:hypothetical protein